jgi:hypothetical protein
MSFQKCFKISGQIEGIVPEWMDLYFPGNGALLTTTVDLAKSCHGLTGFSLLLNFFFLRH